MIPIARLLERGPSYVLRECRKRVLRARFRRGAANRARELAPEGSDPTIIETGGLLRDRLIAEFAGKHANLEYRVLMYQPRSLTADIWFGDLATCMRHAGIACRVLPPESTGGEINRAIEDLRPNIFIAPESRESLVAIDLEFLRRYKRESECLRLFVPVWNSRAPNAVRAIRSTPAEDEWRRGLRARGLSADAYFSIFEAEFHRRFSHDPAGPPIEYVPIPQGCNPFVDYPRPLHKRHDYFMASSMTDERVEVAYECLRPVLGGYRGLWVGPHWGFGHEFVRPADMPVRYAQTRIALSPLVRFVIEFGAELTHRVFAASACGAFQITSRSSIAARYFRPDELVQASSPAEFGRLFEHYVDRPAERNAIALAALRRAYAEHTCFHRIDQLVVHWNDWRRRGMF